MAADAHWCMCTLEIAWTLFYPAVVCDEATGWGGLLIDLQLSGFSAPLDWGQVFRYLKFQAKSQWTRPSSGILR